MKSYLTRTKNPIKIFRDGDFATRLSFLIMGFGNIHKKQLVKGILLLLAEVVFIVAFVTFFFQSIIALPGLGSVPNVELYNPITGLNEYLQIDNSMLILLYGTMSVVITLLFIALWYLSVLSAFEVQYRQEHHIPIQGFLQEALDSKFYVTIMLVPMAGIFFFTIFPLVFMICIAFTNYNQLHMPPGNLFDWVGFDNFIQLFGANPRLANTFGGVLLWTIIWAIVATSTNYVLGMLLAMLISRKSIKFKPAWRTIFVTTIAVPQFVSLMLMGKFLEDQGMLNNILRDIGIIDVLQKMGAIDKNYIPFLSNGTTAKFTIIMVNLWVGIPYTMLITTGILMNIPASLYESAKIDGATPARMYVAITLPYMLFVTAPYLITQFIGNLNNFNVIYLLTGGGPSTNAYFGAGRTDLLVTWLYKLTVDTFDYNLASVIGIIMFIISALMGLISFNITASGKKEEDFQA